MKVSLNWAQYYSNVDLKAIDVKELVRSIGAQLGAVEEVVDWGARYDKVIVAKVITCDKHPDADRLSVCTIDDGGAVEGVERTADGHVQVVCGAPNVKAGLLVAWIPPGAVVPSTVDKDPFTLEARAIRGKVSNGMLASAAELGISDNHDGIVELAIDELAEGTDVGSSFGKALLLDSETIIDCENKMFTHRPDCFGILGVARELAGIQHQAFTSPDWYLQQPAFGSANDLPLEVIVESPELVPRFMAVAIKDVVVEPSPLWLQAGLTRLGTKPVNNIVDITNYVMHVTGQPMHAYDYDKVKAKSSGTPKLIARKARKGDKATLLNGKTIAFEDPAIVIATDKEAIALGGVMGGVETEVDMNTQNIILEVANFDMYNIRRTSMKYGLFTDAVTRFTKGQSIHQTDRALSYAMKDMCDLSGGKQASGIIDIHGPLERPRPVSVDPAVVNERLGLDLSAKEMASLLQNVEIEVQVGSGLVVTPPFWRTDIEIAEDVIEEVGRLYGFDKVPVELPKRTIKPAKANELLQLKSRLRTLLAQAGANEVLTYSFVHGNLLDKVGQTREQAYELSNALSPDLQYYRLSLTPSLLDKVHQNIRAGGAEFMIYEINKAHTKTILEDNLPLELEHMAGVYAVEDKLANATYSGSAFYQASKYVRTICKKMNVTSDVFLIPLAEAKKEHPYDSVFLAPYDEARSAAIVDNEGWLWGVVGEYKQSVQRALKLPKFCAGFELNVKLFLKYGAGTSYRALSRFPYSVQDLSLRVADSVSYRKITTLLQEVLDQGKAQHGWDWLVTPVSIYQPVGSNEKTFSFRIRLNHPARTLTTEEVSNLLDKLATVAKEQLGSERV